MVIKKLNKLVLIIILVCLSSCTFDDKHTLLNYDVPNDFSLDNNINRLNMDYEIKEIDIPNQLLPNDGTILQQGIFYNNIAYFQTLDKNSSNIYPTKDLFVYHTDTQQLDKIKSYTNNIRVIDYRIINSDLYEIQIEEVDNLYICNIVLNDKILQSYTIVDPQQAPYFTNVNGKLQYLITSIHNNSKTLELCEINDNKISLIFSEDVNFNDGRNLMGKKLDVGTLFQNSTYSLSFAMNIDNDTESIYSYDGTKLVKVNIKNRIYHMIPLNTGTLLITYNILDNAPSFKYYWYNLDINKIVAINMDEQRIEKFSQVSYDQFLYSTDDKKTAVASIDKDGNFQSRILDKIPTGICFYGNINEYQDFIFLNDTTQEHLTNNLHFYIINWK